MDSKSAGQMLQEAYQRSRWGSYGVETVVAQAYVDGFHEGQKAPCERECCRQMSMPGVDR